MPTIEELSVKVAEHGITLEVHTSDIRELKVMVHETLEVMKGFSEKVTRLLTLSDQAHVPATCPLGKDVSELWPRFRAVETKQNDDQHVIARLLETVERMDKELRYVDSLRAERQRTEGSNRAWGWLINGGIERIVTVGGMLYLVAQKMLP
jgi:hypothetical protein